MSSILTILWIFEGILYHPNKMSSFSIMFCGRVES
jgi:hypothetical protein